MSAAFDRVIDEIDALTQEEKELVAHRLIESLDIEQEQGADEAWKTLAEQRLASLASGSVQGTSWDEIKQDIKSG